MTPLKAPTWPNPDRPPTIPRANPAPAPAPVRANPRATRQPEKRLHQRQRANRVGKAVFCLMEPPADPPRPRRDPRVQAPRHRASRAPRRRPPPGPRRPALLRRGPHPLRSLIVWNPVRRPPRLQQETAAATHASRIAIPTASQIGIRDVRWDARAQPRPLQARPDPALGLDRARDKLNVKIAPSAIRASSATIEITLVGIVAETAEAIEVVGVAVAAVSTPTTDPTTSGRAAG